MKKELARFFCMLCAFFGIQANMMFRMEGGIGYASLWAGIMVAYTVFHFFAYGGKLVRFSRAMGIISLACNATVVFANGGHMPILAATRSTLAGQHGYVALTDSSRLWWLADVLPGKTSLGDWFVIPILASCVSVLLWPLLSAAARWLINSVRMRRVGLATTAVLLVCLLGSGLAVGQPPPQIDVHMNDQQQTSPSRDPLIECDNSSCMDREICKYVRCVRVATLPQDVVSGWSGTGCVIVDKHGALTPCPEDNQQSTPNVHLPSEAEWKKVLADLVALKQRVAELEKAWLKAAKGEPDAIRYGHACGQDERLVPTQDINISTHTTTLSWTCIKRWAKAAGK